MTEKHPTALIMAGLLCLGLTLGGCSSSRETADTSTVAASSTAVPALVSGDGTFTDPATADRSDADSTAEVAALILHSWDTVTDRTQTAAALRARPLMSEHWAAEQIEPERNAAQGAWLEPSKHEAYSSPSIIAATGDVSRDVAPDKVIRAYDVSWRWSSRDGQDLEMTGRQLVTLYLEQHDGRWEVVGHQYQSID